MKRALFLLILAWDAAAANDLLKVGKTPAEKLDEKVQVVKDNVDRALAKIEARHAATTRMLKRPFSAAGTETAAPAALPDPTAPDEAFRQSFRALLRGHGGGTDPARLPPLPGVALAALVLKPDAAPAALLKIDDQVVLVKVGEEISLIRKGSPVRLQVQSIGGDGVRVLVLPHNELLTLH